MRTDPRVACEKPEVERVGWAVLHDLLAHPFMALTGYSRAALNFHNWTSLLAWPRPAGATGVATGHKNPPTARQRCAWGIASAQQVGPGMWQVQHPTVNHAVTLRAANVAEAVVRAEDWFQSLENEFGGRFTKPVGVRR